jgi:hypothetical protein
MESRAVPRWPEESNPKTVTRRRALPAPNQLIRGEMFWPGAGPEAKKGGATVGWGASSNALHKPIPAAMTNMASDCTIRGLRLGHAARVVVRENIILDKVGQRQIMPQNNGKCLLFVILQMKNLSIVL